jgi:hypothetical protein
MPKKVIPAPEPDDPDQGWDGRIWTVGSGLLSSRAFGKHADTGDPKGVLAFLQITNSYIGFNKPARPDVVSTPQAALEDQRATAGVGVHHSHGRS